MLKNFRYFKRKMQMEILMNTAGIICTVCIVLILCPLAAVNCRAIYADASDWFFRLKEKMQAEKLPWD